MCSGVLLTLILGGCAPTTSVISVTAATTESKAAQDAETFEQQYAKYVSLPLDEISEDDLTPLLTGDLLAESTKEIADTRERGTQVIGKYTYSRFAVTDQGIEASGQAYMVAQACLDVTGSRIHDSSGIDITPDRDPLVSMQLKAVTVDDGSWRISDAVRNDEVKACD
ncbi:hypothetical protein DZF99_01035 [Clavibacter phaseoli]|nr:hypothetical protein DZF99_01035 [Clavibacter phaseoli]